MRSTPKFYDQTAKIFSRRVPIYASSLLLTVASSVGCGDEESPNESSSFGTLDGAVVGSGVDAQAAGDAAEATDAVDATGIVVGADGAVFTDASQAQSADATAEPSDAAPMSTPDGGGRGRTQGCGKPAQPTPRNGQARTVAVNGVTQPREYILDIPPGYAPDTAYPIVFGFHGAGSSASTFRGAFYGNLPGTAGSEAILVHPMALAGTLGTPAWNSPSDLTFFDAILAELSAELCIDSDRIFATGHSSGGFMTNQLGCMRGDVLRAIAPLAGGGPFGRNCVGQVAAWIEHGEEDLTVRLSSGEASRDFWVRANHCEGMSSAPVAPSPCVSYAGCDSGFPVHFCVQPRQTHAPMPRFSAPGAWAFFKSL